jgi:hypothetical protein
MSDVLTVGEMESRFQSEWVLVENRETDDSLRPTRASNLS